ncbi:hypothetical protein HOY82DRAFT_544249 [Tuber indicum]|nr:hypothetical protein HOY82DRAFT_544249 [Tuber indicum]
MRRQRQTQDPEQAVINDAMLEPAFLAQLAADPRIENYITGIQSYIPRVELIAQQRRRGFILNPLFAAVDSATEELDNTTAPSSQHQLSVPPSTWVAVNTIPAAGNNLNIAGPSTTAVNSRSTLSSGLESPAPRVRRRGNLHRTSRTNMSAQLALGTDSDDDSDERVECLVDLTQVATISSEGVPDRQSAQNTGITMPARDPSPYDNEESGNESELQENIVQLEVPQEESDNVQLGRHDRNTASAEGEPDCDIMDLDQEMHHETSGAEEPGVPDPPQVQRAMQHREAVPIDFMVELPRVQATMEEVQNAQSMSNIVRPTGDKEVTISVGVTPEGRANMYSIQSNTIIHTMSDQTFQAHDSLSEEGEDSQARCLETCNTLEANQQDDPTTGCGSAIPETAIELDTTVSLQTITRSSTNQPTATRQDPPSQAPEFHQALKQNYDRGFYRGIEQTLCIFTPKHNPALSPEKLKLSNPVEAESLYDSLIKPYNIIRLARFLSKLSGADGPFTGMATNITLDELTFKPFTQEGSMEVSAATKLESMMSVCRSATRYVESHDLDAELEKLKLLLSYSMMYLTLENGIVPWLRTENPELGAKAINGAKWGEFLNRLNNHSDISITRERLNDIIRYGKVIWTMVEWMGVIVLPMLAVISTPTTLLARTHGIRSKHTEYVSSLLSENQTWTAICHSWGPVAVEVMFAELSERYSTKNLFCMLLHEPLPSESLPYIHREYLKVSEGFPPVRQIGYQASPPTFSLAQASSILQELGLMLNIFPFNKFPCKENHQVELVRWLLEQDGGGISPNPDPVLASKLPLSFPVTVLTSFLPPGHIAPEAVTFLSAAWNSRALSGWALLSPPAIRQLLIGDFGPDLPIAIESALGGLRFHIEYENIIAPLVTNNTVLPMHISFIEKTVSIIKTEDTGATDKAAYLWVQKLKENILFDGWSITEDDNGWRGDEQTPTLNQAYLRYLHFAHVVVTGSRLYNELPSDGGPNNYARIIGACFTEGYQAMNRDVEMLSPECCGFGRDLE